jgi:aminoglycoside phosphotransferase family enzyme/predicted kinase
MRVRGAHGAVAETHVSYVFFTADRVFKLKKPVRTPFLDYSTLARRAEACRREVLLNRRLAADVYLTAAEVVGEDGTVIDHMVVMRRLPAGRRLSVLVAGGAPGVHRQLDRVAEVLAAFHAAAARSAAVDAQSTAQALARRWAANTAELRELADPDNRAALGAIDRLAVRYLAGRGVLFDERIAAGRAVDGHGDLLADDIFCLDDGPRILDCLEFDDNLRFGDGLADAAFLAMDLERLGRPDLSRDFLASYARAAGDTWPGSLADHHLAYRAQVRAKVAYLRGEEREGRQLLGMARRHLRRAEVRLVLVGGAPGTGKSTLAAGLGEELGWPVLRSDVVRKELAGLRPGASAAAPVGAGIYRREVTARCYRELLARAADRLARGESVLLDATWPTRHLRAAARRQAEESVADLVELRCEAPAAVAAARVAERTHRGADASDADAHVAAVLRVAAEPWPEARSIDTSTGAGAALRQARDEIDNADGGEIDIADGGGEIDIADGGGEAARPGRLTVASTGGLPGRERSGHHARP